MRWALRKAPENLTDRQRIALAQIQQTNAQLYRAYLLKEQLRALYHLDDPADAAAHLDAWLAWASRSKLAPFVRLARTLRRYRDGILAAVTLGLTNARLEGLHSKVRLLSHRSFGFHSAAPSSPSSTSAAPASPSTRRCDEPTQTREAPVYAGVSEDLCRHDRTGGSCLPRGARPPRRWRESRARSRRRRRAQRARRASGASRRRGAPASGVAPSPSCRRVRRCRSPRVRDRLADEVIDELLAGARTEEEIVGPGGVLAQLTKRLVERAMSAS